MRHYLTLDIPENFPDPVRSDIEATLADEQASLRALHQALTDKLAELDRREDRLIDLAEAGLPQHKIRARLNKLREDRARLVADQTKTGAQLATGAETLMAAVELTRDVLTLYANAIDEVRGLLNDAFFTKLFLDDDGVRSSRLRGPFGEIIEAAELFRPVNTSQTGSAPAAQRSAPRHHDQTVTAHRGGVVTLSDLLVRTGGRTPRGFE